MATTKDDVVAASVAAYTAAGAALDVAQDFAGVPRTSAQIADLQAQNAQLKLDKQSLQAQLDDAKAKIAAARAAAQADKDADAASVAGQGVLDALA